MYDIVTLLSPNPFGDIKNVSIVNLQYRGGRDGWRRVKVIGLQCTYAYVHLYADCMGKGCTASVPQLLYICIPLHLSIGIIILVHAHMCVQQSCNDIFHSLLPNKRVVAFRWPMSILVSLVLNVTFNIHLLQKFLTTNTHPFCNLKNA